MAILTKLILSVKKEFFHCFVSSLISFFNILAFRVCIDLSLPWLNLFLGILFVDTILNAIIFCFLLLIFYYYCMVLILLRCVPSIATLVIFFIMNVFLNFSLFHIIIYWKNHMIFIFTFVNVIYHADFFVNVKPSWWP